MNNIYDKYILEFNSINTAFSNVYDYREHNREFIIIEAEKYSNPTNYSRMVFKKLNLKGNETVVLDLSNLSGLSTDSFYIWNFIIKNNELYDEKFTKINLLNNSEFEKNFKDYLFKKMKKIRDKEYQAI